MGILLMYDVTSLESFNNLTYWLKNIEENASPDVVKVLAGNKCDVAKRVVDTEMGQKIAENYDIPFYEVSCKQNINIETIFLKLARLIRDQRSTQTEHLDSGQNENIHLDLKSRLFESSIKNQWKCAC